MKNKPKQSFVRKIKRTANREWESDFHLSISSKALFNLSDQALKLYIFFLLQGKGKYISTKTLAVRLKKSERSVQRYRDELKELGFLRVHMITPTKFQYTFDPKGLLNEEVKVKKRKEIELVEETEKEIKEVEVEVEVTEEQTEENFILEKARTIIDYSDFAILENKYWNFDDETKKQIKSILENRFKKELENREAIEWFLDKTNY